MKNKNSSHLKLFLAVCITLLLNACSTTKNTGFYRGWHNMTARFNGYYYSNENIKETVAKIEEAHKDDFSKLIPLFIATDNTSSKSYYSDCDKTIKKSSIVIQRHTIKEKKSKKEIPNACKWIDENYMLIGKAHFYKRDLFSALEVFEYVSKIYPNPEAKYNGMLWMIRTNNEIGSFSLSESSFDDIRNAKDFPTDTKYQRELAAVTADYFIKREDYPQAIANLTKAISLSHDKKTKARYTYVLAQLYEKVQDNNNASRNYEIVSKLHPSYDMEFNAQIKWAMLYDISSGESQIIKKQLNKMLKDAKYIEFHDQIYYALAEISQKEGDTPLALTYLEKSIKASTTNNTQKALSFLKRGDIYFEVPDYISAHTNYDSTMIFLPKDYVDYAVIQEKEKSLKSLVTNLNIIASEDSLQVLAKMSEKDRNSQIDKMIAKSEEDEKRLEEELLNQQAKPATFADPNINNGGSKWYFYNPTTVNFGIGEFTKKWGARVLEDNWRRSEKKQNIAEDENINGSDTVKVLIENESLASKRKKKKDAYFKKIPMTPVAMDSSNLKIVEAYYNVGSIYKEQLQNNKKSAETFLELLKRYPENKYKLSSYYQLYRLYIALNNQTKADYYKNILLTDYPTSDYAIIIKNPSHAADIAANRSQVEKFYTETYQLYTAGNYSQAYENCKKAESSYSKSSLMPQFSFLKALCIAKTQDVASFENALTQVIVNYPKSPVKDKAQEMLDAIKAQKKSTLPPDSLSSMEKSKYTFKEEGDYYCIIIVENGKGDLNKFKTKLSNYNTASFSIADISISNIILDPKHQLVNVKAFNGKSEAMNYYTALQLKKEVFNDLQFGGFQTFVISSENFSIFFKEKNIDEYMQFFKLHFFPSKG